MSEAPVATQWIVFESDAGRKIDFNDPLKNRTIFDEMAETRHSRPFGAKTMSIRLWWCGYSVLTVADERLSP
ncbi:hypothetical protein [Sphingomonas sp. RB1R13]|uniref:hypothetical protein n=1 Tax=Sphingomonas sp. RB1R13 TaxID=3096159 RepID=UPI002FC5DE82